MKMIYVLNIWNQISENNMIIFQYFEFPSGYIIGSAYSYMNIYAILSCWFVALWVWIKQLYKRQINRWWQAG